MGSMKSGEATIRMVVYGDITESGHLILHQACREKTWIISHIPTGHAIATFTDNVGALRAILELDQLSWDFYDKNEASRLRRKTKRIVENRGGKFLDSRAGVDANADPLGIF